MLEVFLCLNKGVSLQFVDWQRYILGKNTHSLPLTLKSVLDFSVGAITAQLCAWGNLLGVPMTLRKLCLPPRWQWASFNEAYVLKHMIYKICSIIDSLPSILPFLEKSSSDKAIFPSLGNLKESVFFFISFILKIFLFLYQGSCTDFCSRPVLESSVKPATS